MFRNTRLSLLCAVAKELMRRKVPLPLNIYAELDQAGVDLNELERIARNGEA